MMNISNKKFQNLMSIKKNPEIESKALQSLVIWMLQINQLKYNMKTAKIMST